MTTSATNEQRSYWGYGIAAVYAVFAVATVGFVIFAMTQRIDLVAPDYYARELHYEQQIHRARRGQEPGHEAQCRLTPAGDALRLRFPAELSAISGRLLLYRPSDPAQDREITLAPDARGEQLVPLAGLAAGAWRARMTWRAAGREYYNEAELTLPRQAAREK
ncbi:MAG: FixH family protein [Blastocatellia bacterium]